MTTIYTAKATTIAGREGYSETDDKQLAVNLSKPGSGKPGTNPEQLFAIGYSACFGGAVDAVAKSQKVELSEVKIEATVNLDKDEKTGFSISVELNASLTGTDAATAAKIVEAAHQMCPYSKATRGNIDVKLKVNNQPLAKAA